MKKKGKNVFDDFAQTFSELKSFSESEDSKNVLIAKNTKEQKSIENKSTEHMPKTQKSKELKSIEGESAEEKIKNEAIRQETIEQNSIEYNAVNVEDQEQYSMELKPIECKTIEQFTMDQKSIELNAEKKKRAGIHPTSIRVVKEELLKALGVRVSAELKIGDIAPLTGLTRRTVDRVCKYLEENGDFSFERQHRGMKVTALKS
jgi:hypothetical protein